MKNYCTKPILFFAILFLIPFMGTSQSKSFNYTAFRTQTAPTIDGKGDEPCWKNASWALINKPFDGKSLPDSADFFGRYKIVWTPERIYILMEITDDKLMDNRVNPKDNYWEDDCTEFFIDEDHLPQGHECGADAYKAFAYHIAAVPREKNNYSAGNIVDFSSADGINHVIDLGKECNTSKAVNLDDHVSTKISKNGNQYTWELEFKIFDKNYIESNGTNTPVTLSGGKVMGFAIAYCDNDNGKRENMIGTIPNHNDYSGPYPFYRFTNEFGTLTLDNSSFPTSGKTIRNEKNHQLIFCKTTDDNKLQFTDPQFASRVSELKIVSLSGKMMLKKHGNIQFNENISNLSPGIYIVEVKSSGTIYRQKIQKT